MMQFWVQIAIWSTLHEPVWISESPHVSGLRITNISGPQWTRIRVGSVSSVTGFGSFKWVRITTTCNRMHTPKHIYACTLTSKENYTHR